MRIKIRYFIISIIVLLLLVVFVDYLLGVPRVFSINKDLDLNSGDERVYVYVCFLKIKDEIRPTPFSREIRRLCIDVPKERKWIITHMKVFMILHKKYICPVYGGTLTECNFLTGLFDYGDVPDENRRIILQEIMTILQNANKQNVSHMITEKVQAESEKILKSKQ